MVVQASMVGIINTLDVISLHRLRPEYGVLRPILWEGTAGVTVLLAALIPWMLLRYFRIERRPIWQAAIVTILCAPLFSVVHVASFVALRMAIYAADGLRYDLVRSFPVSNTKRAATSSVTSARLRCSGSPRASSSGVSRSPLPVSVFSTFATARD
jgi:hypothetical protein